MSARAACSCVSPFSRKSMSRGGTPPAATTRRDSSVPVAAIAATAAAALALASALPADNSRIISSRASFPWKLSLAGAGGGAFLAAPPAFSLVGSATGTGATKPPSLARASAAALRSAVGGSGTFTSAWLDSRSTIWSWPGRRGVKSTQTPDSLAFHQRMCATKAFPSGSSANSYTANPFTTVQPSVCCTRAALPNGSSGRSSIAAALATSSALGVPVRRQRLPTHMDAWGSVSGGGGKGEVQARRPGVRHTCKPCLPPWAQQLDPASPASHLWIALIERLPKRESVPRPLLSLCAFLWFLYLPLIHLPFCRIFSPFALLS
eukprot:scaffold156039_cov24-Tisochrysis_lutea.AAC.5